MVHPLLFLEFFRKMLAPLHIPDASADAISYTWLIIVLLLVLSLLATSALKSIPSGMQNFMETVIGGIEGMIVDTMGEQGRPFFPLIATLAIFVLVSNLIGLIPGFFPPTANINTTAACAIIVFVSTHIVGLVVFTVPESFNRTVRVYQNVNVASRLATLFDLCFIAEGTGQLGLVFGELELWSFTRRQDARLLIPGLRRVRVTKQKRRADKHNTGRKCSNQCKES